MSVLTFCFGIVAGAAAMELIGYTMYRVGSSMINIQ